MGLGPLTSNDAAVARCHVHVSLCIPDRIPALADPRASSPLYPCVQQNRQLLSSSAGINEPLGELDSDVVISKVLRDKTHSGFCQ